MSKTDSGEAPAGVEAGAAGGLAQIGEYRLSKARHRGDWDLGGKLPANLCSARDLTII